MKIAVVGSREFKYKNIVIAICRDIFINPDDIFISGGAIGVDTWAEECIYPEINKMIFKPNWDKYGKSAGFLRNEDIIRDADKCIAFWDGKSKGTKHSIDLAIKKGIPVDIYIRQ